MEDALALSMSKQKRLSKKVLILVVMEDALAHNKKNRVEDPKSLS